MAIVVLALRWPTSGILDTVFLSTNQVTTCYLNVTSRFLTYAAPRRRIYALALLTFQRHIDEYGEKAAFYEKLLS